MTSIKYIELLVVMSSISDFHGIQGLLSPCTKKIQSLARHKSSRNGVADPGISPKLQKNRRQRIVSLGAIAGDLVRAQKV